MKIKTFKITKKNNLLIALFIGLIVIFLINIIPNNLYSIAIFSVIIYIMFFATWFFQYKNMLNYYSIFLLFTYFFFFGQFFLLLIGVPLEGSRTILSELLPMDMLIKTGELIITSMIILHFGVMLSTYHINKYNLLDPSDINVSTCTEDNTAFRIAALILFSISIIPSCIILIEKISITFSQGYGAIFQSQIYASGGFKSILRFLSLFTLPSILMMIVAFKGTNKIKYIFIILSIYLVLYFLSGSRLSGVLLLFSLLLVKHYWYKPLKLKNMIIILVSAFIGLAIISTISEIRNLVYTSDNIGQLFSDTFANIILRNPIFSTMQEAGYTFLATAAVVTYTPSVIPFHDGMSYLNSLFMIIPNLFWDVHPASAINTDIVFQHFLTENGGIGSSFIAEAYWNLGYGTFFIVFIFGILIGLLTKQIAKYSLNQNTKLFYLFIYIAEFSLFYVRSDTVTFWRNAIYYGVAPLILTALIAKIITIRRSKKQSNKQEINES